ncbi:MAG: endonuclease/exonuclease/phosphatase family protein [Planctomycetota bacterium]
MRVLTLNLMQKSPVAGREERLERIAELVKSRHDAGEPIDALLLQEGCSGVTVGTMDSIGDLAARLGAKGLRYYVRSEPCFGVPNFLVFRVGVLTRADVLSSDGNGLECRTGDWFDDFPLPGRKRVVGLSTSTPMGRVNLFSVHLSSGGSQGDRIRQVRDLIQFVENFGKEHPAEVVIVGGDMNTTPTTDAYQQLSAAWADSYAAAATSSPGHTFNLPGNPHCKGYVGDPRRIDFIFVKGESIRIERSDVVFNSDGWWVSDHCGVLTTLKIRVSSPLPRF